MHVILGAYKIMLDFSETTPYSKNYDELNETERQLLKESVTILSSGEPLYGIHPEDASHIIWTIYQVLQGVDEYGHNDVLTLVQLGKTDQGYFITLLGE